MKRGDNSEPSRKAVACVFFEEKGKDKDKEERNGGDDE